MEIKGDEAVYLKGGAVPAVSSVLTSNSRYLNNPRFRDVFAQEALKRNAGDLPDAFLIPEINRAVAEETDMARLHELLALERERLPRFAAWLDDRFLSDWNAVDLSECGPDTLGWRIRTFIEESGMDIDFMFKDLPQDDFGYLLKRRVQNHDIEHIVTGFDPTPVGEIALIVANAVALANYFTPALSQMLSLQPMFLASASLMRVACHYPEAVPAMLEGFARGQALGSKQEQPLFMIRWEEHIHKSVAQIREEFAFSDGPIPGSGYWNWTYEAARG